MQPVTSTAFARPPSLRSAAASPVSIDSAFAAGMNAQVLTITASACSGSATIRKPEADSMPATFSESTALRPNPSGTMATVGGRSWSRIIDLLGQVTEPGRSHHDATRLTGTGDRPIHTPQGPGVQPSRARQPRLGTVESVEDPAGPPSAELATAAALSTVKERCHTRPLRSGTPSDRPLTVSSTTDGAPSVRSMLRLALNVRRSDVPRTPWKETLPSAVTLVHEGPR